MKRFYVIEKIKDARTVGILVGTLAMAGYKEIIAHLKKIFSACAKKTYTFVVGKLNPNKLANFPEVAITIPLFLLVFAFLHYFCKWMVCEFL